MLYVSWLDGVCRYLKISKKCMDRKAFAHLFSSSKCEISYSKLRLRNLSLKLPNQMDPATADDGPEECVPPGKVDKWNVFSILSREMACRNPDRPVRRTRAGETGLEIYDRSTAVAYYR